MERRKTEVLIVCWIQFIVTAGIFAAFLFRSQFDIFEALFVIGLVCIPLILSAYMGLTCIKNGKHKTGAIVWNWIGVFFYSFMFFAGFIQSVDSHKPADIIAKASVVVGVICIISCIVNGVLIFRLDKMTRNDSVALDGQIERKDE